MYAITTEVRTYNSVNNPKHFAQVREAWGDTSRAVGAQLWVASDGTPYWMKSTALARWNRQA